jgi:hypothetical protein
MRADSRLTQGVARNIEAKIDMIFNQKLDSAREFYKQAIDPPPEAVPMGRPDGPTSKYPTATTTTLRLLSRLVDRL